MAPSAVSDGIDRPELKLTAVRGGIEDEAKPHVHGAEDLTPLQAISHGSMTIAGNWSPNSLLYEVFGFLVLCLAVRFMSFFALQQYFLPQISNIGWYWIGIPTFTNFNEHRRHVLIHTAAIFRDFSRKGFTEGMSGHISVRDPEYENYIWMNPLGRHFGLMTAGDMICLDVNTGAIVGGNKVSWAPFIEPFPQIYSLYYLM